MRYDDTSSSDERGQYRLRAYPSYDFGGSASLHAFVATGDEFDSSWNTIDDNDDEVHVRRLYMRLEDERGKIELGTMPTYKGRVSSTGLSDNGWLKGVRGVLQLKSGRLELVLGELEDIRAHSALSPPDELNYIELEYSGELTDQWSYELSFDRMLDDDFLRGEIRYRSANDVFYSIEAIHNASASAAKVVASMERTLTVGARPVEWFVYYAYAEPRFGQRAELTEDFLDFGHALANEFSGAVADSDRLSWFVKAEVYEDRARGQLGLEFDFR